MIMIVKAAAGALWFTLAFVVGVSVLAISVAVILYDLRPGGASALYFVIWWITLFAILPFGIRSQAETEDVTAGTDPGAPSVPALREKAIWTTLAASAVMVLASALLPLAGL
jgi:predicted secreted protein